MGTMRMRWTWLMLWIAGCAAPPPTQQAPKNMVSASIATPAAPATAPTTAPVAAPKPFVLHLPGVSGTSQVDMSLCEGLSKAGFDGPLQIYDWTCHDPGIPALHNRARNEAQAAIVAKLLTRQYRAHPEQPIYLTCHSGGAGPATWALERLPDDVKVTCFVMLAPALSPQYDLSKALSHVSGRAYCFNSPLDDLVLGTGTMMFGTIDGVRCDAAGRVGFTRPATGDPVQYAKLVHETYQKSWVHYGHIGGHIGCMGAPFVQAIVAPVMLGHDVVEKVIGPAVAQPLPDVLWPK